MIPTYYCYLDTHEGNNGRSSPLLFDLERHSTERVNLVVFGKSVQPCCKPAAPVKSSPEHVRLLTPLLEAHAAALARTATVPRRGKHRTDIFAACKAGGGVEGVRAHAVELSTLSPNQDPRSQLMNSNWSCFRCRRICAGSRIMFNR